MNTVFSLQGAGVHSFLDKIVIVAQSSKKNKKQKKNINQGQNQHYHFKATL